jgi:hypothetical protein
MRFTELVLLGRVIPILATQKVLQDERNPLNEEFKKYVLSALEDWHVPGLAIAVVDGEHTWSAVSI